MMHHQIALLRWSVPFRFRLRCCRFHLVRAFERVRPHCHGLVVVGELEGDGRVGGAGHRPLQVATEPVLLNLSGPELREAVRKPARDRLGAVHFCVRAHEEVVIVQGLVSGTVICYFRSGWGVRGRMCMHVCVCVYVALKHGCVYSV